MNLGRRRTTIFVVVILLGTLIPIFNIPESSGGLSDPSSLTNHSYIHINGNNGFNSTNGVVRGNGTKENPYVIENWSIDAKLKDGIKIENTNLSFTIRNCYIYNALSSGNWGIYLNYVKNGSIINNSLKNNNGGIAIYYSSNNFVLNNSLINNSINNYETSIMVWHSLYNRIENNFINNSYWGIRLIESSDNSIENNKVINSYSEGIRFAFESNNNLIYNNTLENNSIGIFLSEATYAYKNRISSNLIYNNRGYGIYLYNANNCTIDFNVIYNNSHGIIHNSYATKNKIFNNYIYNNEFGIRFTGPDNILFNNTIYNNSYNIGFQTVKDYSFNQIIYSNNTVDGKPIYYWNGQSNKTIPSDAGFVGLLNCNNIKVTNLTLKKNYQQIILISTTNCTIENNTIFDSYDGIFLSSSNNNSFNNNTLYNNHCGINLLSSEYNSISNNRAFNNTLGICLNIISIKNKIYSNNAFNNSKGILINGKPFDNELFNNYLFNNIYGILFHYWTYNNYVTNNSIYNNTIMNNSYGISINKTNEYIIFNNIICNNSIAGLNLQLSHKNLIYNNYFSNINNYNVSGCIGNVWNISKKSGKNIIGGPYLGGNYWSNYTGKDINGDGFGDIKIPYGQGDFLPLCNQNDLIKPNIIDKTVGSPTTDKDFSIIADVFDNINVTGIYLKYWFDQNESNNESMNRINGNNQRGNYSRSIYVPFNAQKLRYVISAVDYYNNWNCIKILIINVIDDIKPDYIQDLSDIIAYTNETFNFALHITDNIEPISAAVEYYYGSSSQKLFNTLSKDGNYFNGSIQIPNSLEKLNYRFLFNDSNPDNTNTTNFKEIDVLDREKPIVIAGTGDIETTTGEDFELYAKFSDNIGIGLVKIFYSNGTAWLEKVISSGIEGRYSILMEDLLIETTYDIAPWRYYFYAEDTSGNGIYYGREDDPFIITVIDNDKPTANAGNDIIAIEGETVTFDGSNSTDNIGNIDFTWTFEYNGEQKKLEGEVTSFEFEKEGTYDVTLKVSDDAGNWNTDKLSVIINPAPPDKDPRVELTHPLNQAILLGPTVELSWKIHDLDTDLLTYNVYLGTSPNPPLDKSKIDTTELDVPIFDDLVYYWKVQVWVDNKPGPVSPIWSFQVSHPIPNFDVDISSQYTDYELNQSESGTITVSIQNNQDKYSDWIKIDVDVNDFPDELTLSKDKLYIGPGKTQEVYLNFTLNGSTPVGSYPLTITATSQGALEYELDVKDLITINIIVQEKIIDDSDGDNLPDWWEVEWFGDIEIYIATDDPDKDGKDNLQEYLDKTDPTKPDLGPGGGNKPNKDPEDNLGMIIGSAVVIVIIGILLLVFLLFMQKKKKGDGNQPEIETQEPTDPPTPFEQTPGQQTTYPYPPQQPGQTTEINTPQIQQPVQQQPTYSQPSVMEYPK